MAAADRRLGHFARCRALGHRQCKALRDAPEIHLVNVQAVLPSDIGRFINAETIKEFHLENGMKALPPRATNSPPPASHPPCMC
jgi:hypothetical protein